MLGLKPTKASGAEADFQLKGFDDFTVSLGDTMRGERATLGKSLMDVQRELRIKSEYIEAIESADPTVFDTPGFISGYVKSYAKYLKLDPEWAFDEFCKESGFAKIYGMSEEASKSREKPLAQMVNSQAGDLEKSTVLFTPPSDTFFMAVSLKTVMSALILGLLVGVIGYGVHAVVKEVQRVHITPIDQPPVVVFDVEPISPSGSVGPQGEVLSVGVEPVPPLERYYQSLDFDVPAVSPRDGPISSIDPSERGALLQSPPIAKGLNAIDMHAGGSP